MCVWHARTLALRASQYQVKFSMGKNPWTLIFNGQKFGHPLQFKFSFYNCRTARSCVPVLPFLLNMCFFNGISRDDTTLDMYTALRWGFDVSLYSISEPCTDVTSKAETQGLLRQPCICVLRNTRAGQFRELAYFPRARVIKYLSPNTELWRLNMRD